MKIMLFGGSFDPPHLGHQTMAEEIIRKKIADEVWFVPCYKHPFDKKISPVKERLEMLSFLVSDKIKICDYEIKKDEISFTIDTLNYFSQKMPDNEFSLLIGSDQLQNFCKWKNYQDILKNYQVFVYPRIDYPVNNLYKEMIILSDVREVPVSSTVIRQGVAKKENVGKMLNSKVEKYIKNYSLYIKYIN
jgi:nicotinate-nucleotide adenylyltransferase